MSDQSSDIAVYECSNCGGNLQFKPGIQSLQCPFCGTANDIPGDNAPEIYEELDYEQALANLESATGTVLLRNVPCTGCGAQVTFESEMTTAECVYCGTQVVRTGDQHKSLRPQYILPFTVARPDAAGLFRKWIATRRFAPSALKKYSRISEPLKGLYYPFWTFDAGTSSSYTGMRGIFYTEQIRTRNSEGKTVTRTVTKTRWFPASGTVSRAFDDVLVPASRSLPEDLVGKAQDFPLNQCVGYDSRFLSGFHGESYGVELKDGFSEAKRVMDEQIRSDVRRDIGGDTQRITTLHTSFADVTFKYLVLPLYVLKYRFKDRFFPVLINGVTGTIAGKRPFSWIKILATVFIAAAVIVGGYFLLRYFGVGS